MRMCAVFMFIFLVSFASAVPQLNLQKESYQAQETLIGTIDNTNATLTRESIRIYEDRRELSLDKDVANYEGKYYFYLVLPKEGVFRIEIKSLLYTENGVLKSTDIVKNITVKNKVDENNKTNVLGIRPGIVSSFLNTDSIYLTNFGTNDLTAFYLNKNFSLASGKSEKINITLNKSFDNLLIKSYEEFSVPLIYLGYAGVQNQTTQNTTLDTPLKIINVTATVDGLKIKIIRGEKKEYNFSLINRGSSLENLEISGGSVINISSKLNSFENNSIQKIFFNISYNNKTFYNDSIVVKYNHSEIFRLPVEIYLFENESSAQISNISVQPIQKDCVSIGGKLCAVNENCEGDYVDAGGLCCFGSCVFAGATPTSPIQILIGIAILALVCFVGYYFYKKIKNVKLPSAEEKMRKMSGLKN